MTIRNIKTVGTLWLLAVMGIAFAPEAAAINLPTLYIGCTDNGQYATPRYTFSASAGGQSSVYAASGDTLSVTNNANSAVTISSASGYSISPSPIAASGSGSLQVGASSTTITFTAAGGNCDTKTAQLQFVVTGGGPAPDGGVTSSAETPAPVLETLSLSLTANGASCTGGNPTGYSGTWMTLPKAEDCKQSGPTAKPGAKLLGWSPNANFPVDVAQNQVSKGWGVYDGPINGVRMIFIPAGMSTFVSGSNTLYPVWSE